MFCLSTKINIVAACRRVTLWQTIHTIKTRLLDINEYWYWFCINVNSLELKYSKQFNYLCFNRHCEKKYYYCFLKLDDAKFQVLSRKKCYLFVIFKNWWSKVPVWWINISWKIPVRHWQTKFFSWSLWKPVRLFQFTFLSSDSHLSVICWKI